MNTFFTPKDGKFGAYGGRFAPELLQPVLAKVEEAFATLKASPEYQAEFDALLRDFAGRPTPLYKAENFSRHCGGATIYVKREDLLHGGAHKTNNVVGQALLARIMGAKALIAETGAGQHGIATAMAGARFGLPVKIFMGEKDIARQKVNVERMKLLGAEVICVTSGSRSLKDAINEAMRYWISHSEETYYVFGTAAGPSPFPELVSYFQRIIGLEARQQILEKTGRLPDAVFACVGGGSNAVGIFQGFLSSRGDTSPLEEPPGTGNFPHSKRGLNSENTISSADAAKKREKMPLLVGVEPAGDGIHHGMTLGTGETGCLHGSISKVMNTDSGQIQESHSISAGLDYPGISPIHAALQDAKRAEYVGIEDDVAMQNLLDFSRLEGIIPAIESAHALAEAARRAPKAGKDSIFIVNLSGRGDKDLHTIFEWMEGKGLLPDAPTL